jgi:hypothetical protein
MFLHDPPVKKGNDAVTTGEFHLYPSWFYSLFIIEVIIKAALALQLEHRTSIYQQKNILHAS